MAAARNTLSNYAQLMRLSNLPTCVANVLTGAAIGMQFQDASLTKLAILVVSICCYYCGGMILNDLCDLKYDRMHRPQGPIVTGSISFLAALVFSWFLFFLARTIIFFIAEHALIPAAVLLLCIILYDILHKKFSASVVFMGACRALVYITCAIAVAGPSQSSAVLKASLPFAIIIGFYTLSITIVARMENQGRIDWRKWLSVAMPLVLIGVLFFVRPTRTVYAIIAAILLIGWMAYACRFVFTKPPKIKSTVLTWLSGMCLVDVWFLTVLDKPLLAIIALICFIITTYGHKRIPGT
jgi:4-hydroxybenzoate polyprenyltransferase